MCVGNCENCEDSRSESSLKFSKFFLTRFFSTLASEHTYAQKFYEKENTARGTFRNERRVLHTDIAFLIFKGELNSFRVTWSARARARVRFVWAWENRRDRPLTSTDTDIISSSERVRTPIRRFFPMRAQSDELNRSFYRSTTGLKPLSHSWESSQLLFLETAKEPSCKRVFWYKIRSQSQISNSDEKNSSEIGKRYGGRQVSVFYKRGIDRVEQ